MTHHTDAERAEFEKLWAERPIYMGQDHQKELALHWWQAARRAPSMPDQSIIEAVDGWFARNTDLGGCSDKDVAELAAIFAAAPQPPEAGCSVSNGETQAAPVQLPEPAIPGSQGVCCGNFTTGGYYMGQHEQVCCGCPDDAHPPYYTEQQVRQLLTDQQFKLDELAMLTRMVVHAFRQVAPDNKTAAKAVDYLKRKGLAGNPLRAAQEQST